MPRGFTEEERRKIERILLEAGYELFTRYGLKKTSIQELTDRAGIAQGSFYKFFSSKEELYFSIMEREEEKIKRELLTKEILSGKITRKEFRRFLEKAFQLVDKNPFIKGIYQGDEYRQLLKKLPEEKINDHIINDTETLLPLLKNWQETGCLKKKDPEAISGLFRSLFLLTLHQQEIGEREFEKTIDLLIDIMAEGLIKKEEEGNNDEG